MCNAFIQCNNACSLPRVQLVDRDRAISLRREAKRVSHECVQLRQLATGPYASLGTFAMIMDS